MKQEIDIVIAGGGIAGILLAHQIRKRYPNKTWVLLDSELSFGGRLRCTSDERSTHGLGLNRVSDSLFNYWDLCLKDDPDGADLRSLVQNPMQHCAMVSGSRIVEFAAKDIFTSKTFRSFGGNTAAKDWHILAKLSEKQSNISENDNELDEQQTKQSLSHLWTESKKSPALMVLKQICQAVGVVDVMSCDVGHLFKAIDQLAHNTYISDWGSALDALVKNFTNSQILSDCTIVGAAFENERWTVSTRRGQFLCNSLIVAQSPWDAVQWLPREAWPSQVLPLALKAKPISAVVLSEYSEELEKRVYPQLVFIPAENSHAWVTPGVEIAYQTAIDYELSVQAPEVTKAVKMIKRARKKLQLVFPELDSPETHLALVSSAWTKLMDTSDLRLAKRVTAQQSVSLMFCGDAYSAAAGDDEALLDSAEVCLNMLGKNPRKKSSSARPVEITDTPLQEENLNYIANQNNASTDY